MSQEQFIKSVIRQRIKIDDPDVYEAIVDIIYKFAMLLHHGDDNLRKTAIDVVFQVIPEEITMDIIRRYIDRIKKKYLLIRDVVRDMGLDTSGIKGKGLEDMLAGFMLEMFKNQYFAAPKSHDAAQDTQTTVKINAKELPEELKQLLNKQ